MTLPKWRIHAAHILVNSRELAEQCIAWIEESDPSVQQQCFMNLAGMHSLCKSFETGGDIGWFGPGELDKPFEQALCRLKPGQWYNKVVETPAGFHVVARIQ